MNRTQHLSQIVHTVFDPESNQHPETDKPGANNPKPKPGPPEKAHIITYLPMYSIQIHIPPHKLRKLVPIDQTDTCLRTVQDCVLGKRTGGQKHQTVRTEYSVGAYQFLEHRPCDLTVREITLALDRNHFRTIVGNQVIPAIPGHLGQLDPHTHVPEQLCTEGFKLGWHRGKDIINHSGAPL